MLTNLTKVSQPELVAMAASSSQPKFGNPWECKAGDTLFLILEGEVLKVESQASRVRRIQERLRPLVRADHVHSDELIAERR